jgi:hypothetical protein
VYKFHNFYNFLNLRKTILYYEYKIVIFRGYYDEYWNYDVLAKSVTTYAINICSNSDSIEYQLTSYSCDNDYSGIKGIIEKAKKWIEIKIIANVHES